MYFLAPAKDSAPAGSAMTLVSSYRSLIAEQISSVVTVIDESTIFLVNLNVFEPIFSLLRRQQKYQHVLMK